MRLTFLGTGNAGGVPVYGCPCPACTAARQDPGRRRGPCSALVEAAGVRLLLDAGLMDLAERFPPGTLSRILLTHYHADHVQGLFHLRWGVNTAIAVSAPADAPGCADLHKHPGILAFETAEPFVRFAVGEAQITPVPLAHSRPTLGYCIEAEDRRLAYLTDTAGLPPATRDFVTAWMPDLLVLDCSHAPREGPANHNDVRQALAVHEALAPRRTLFTHIGHDADVWFAAHQATLPANAGLAVDGMHVRL